MAALNKVLKTILADTPLIKNLRNAEYMKIILKGCPNLAERLSQIDANWVQKEMGNVGDGNDKILPPIKKMVRDVNLTVKVSALFNSATAN